MVSVLMTDPRFDTYLAKAMSRTIVALNWILWVGTQMAAQAWALSGQVCFTKLYQIRKRKKNFKLMATGRLLDILYSRFLF